MTAVKLLVAIISIVFAPVASFAQREKPAPPGMVRTVRAEKRQLRAVTSYQYGVMVSTAIIDDKGRVLEIAEYLPGGSPDIRSTSTFDEKGNEIESAFYTHDDLSSRSFTRYDSRNRKIEFLSLFGDGKQRNKSVYKYDKLGRRIAFEVNSAGEFVRRAVATLDRRGNERDRVEYNDKGTRADRYVFRFDKAGNKLSETHYYEKEGKAKSSRTTYVYDRDGHVIEYSLYFDGVLNSRETQASRS